MLEVRGKNTFQISAEADIRLQSCELDKSSGYLSTIAFLNSKFPHITIIPPQLGKETVSAVTLRRIFAPMTNDNDF